MKLGFTGTQKGMTPLQQASFTKLSLDLGAEELHHGDCIGADAEAHYIALSHKISIIIHPPTDQSRRAFCEGAKEVRLPKTHFARNRDIVEETTVLVGASLVDHPLERGGTWFTIRYALKKAKKVYVIWPNGMLALL